MHIGDQLPKTANPSHHHAQPQDCLFGRGEFQQHRQATNIATQRVRYGQWACFQAAQHSSASVLQPADGWLARGRQVVHANQLQDGDVGDGFVPDQAHMQVRSQNHSQRSDRGFATQRGSNDLLEVGRVLGDRFVLAEGQVIHLLRTSSIASSLHEHRMR